MESRPWHPFCLQHKINKLSQIWWFKVPVFIIAQFLDVRDSGGAELGDLAQCVSWGCSSSAGVMELGRWLLIPRPARSRKPQLLTPRVPPQWCVDIVVSFCQKWTIWERATKREAKMPHATCSGEWHALTFGHTDHPWLSVGGAYTKVWMPGYRDPWGRGLHKGVNVRVQGSLGAGFGGNVSSHLVCMCVHMCARVCEGVLLTLKSHGRVEL
jgi:hypothetical protein